MAWTTAWKKVKVSIVIFINYFIDGEPMDYGDMGDQDYGDQQDMGEG